VEKARFERHAGEPRILLEAGDGGGRRLFVFGTLRLDQAGCNATEHAAGNNHLVTKADCREVRPEVARHRHGIVRGHVALCPDGEIDDDILDHDASRAMKTRGT